MTFFVLAVTFLLFELERCLLNQKHAKKFFFIVKVFLFSEMLRFRRHTAVFVDFGTFFARIFSALKRAGPVPMTISGENLMFGQPPILYTPLMGTSSDQRNRPSKFWNFFPDLFRHCASILAHIQ